MDKVELGIKLEQIKKLIAKGDYSAAAKIADTIEWRKVKRWSELIIGADLYEKIGRITDARNICIYAYNRNLGGRNLVYRLSELSIILNDLDEADDLYREFIEMAPHDMSRYVLLYKLNKARGVSDSRLIEILEEYKNNELDEQYEYELASLYAKVGRIEECIKECDDLILWFNEGEFVKKALELKSRHAELTPSQSEKYRFLQENESEIPEPDEEYADEQEPVKQEADATEIAEPAAYETPVGSSQMMEIEPEEIEDDFEVPEKDYSLYDTRNIQAELAKSMEIIMAGLRRGDTSVLDLPFAEEAVAALGDTVEIPPVKEEPDEIPVETPDENQVEENAEEVVEEVESEEPEQEKNDEYETVIGETAATTEDTNVEVIEIRNYSEDEVDEPTREIVINTHRWNQVKSEMEEEPQAVPDEAPTEEEAPVKEEVTEESNPVQMELVFEEPTVEGQINILDYLEHMFDEPEPEPEPEPAVEINAEEDQVIKQIIKDITEDLNSRVDVEVMAASLLRERDDEKYHQYEELPIDTIEEKETDTEVSDTEESDSEVIDEEASAEEDLVEKEPIADYLVAEEYRIPEDAEEEYIITTSERKYINKYLFMKGLEQSVAELLKGKKKEKPDGTSRKGNIVIVGKSDMDKVNFAMNLFKSLHAEDNNRELKIAKTSAEVLNKKGVQASCEKIKGTTLIIEKADKLNKEILKDLSEFMEGDTDSMLVIFTGEDFGIKRIFGENPYLAEKFDYKLELKHYTINELVAMAKEYARVKGYIIQDKALLKLYLFIEEIHSDNEGTQIDKVKELVDKAINDCGKKPKNLFGKKTASMVILKEKHFRR